ncbi:MAG: ORC1-type DNA replication protein [Candidatus Altiarchaeales archaeon]|nr:ORC1-type DNA replication protein [Candidatus Altiarchaeales archaeon]MBD3415702.1 ORC1-type DNA replication protein [Candidatus Altiarchaeales archaeon]
MKAAEILLDDETLFRDEEVFTPSYVPEDFIHRDDQLKEISLSLKPGLRGVNPVNTLIHGPPGTGKTTAVKHIFNEVNKVSNKLVTVYVNCDDYNTRFSIFSRIHEAVFGTAPPDTGKPLNAVKEKVFRKLQRENKSLVIALDEIDQLFLNKTIDKLLLDLLKAHTTYGYDKIGIIGVLIDDSIVLGLDSKSSSVFNPVKVYFPPYSTGEVEDILSARITYGLYDGVLSKGLFEYVVEKTVDAGDLRVGIDLIRRSALLAERDSSRKITSDHVELAYERESRRVNLERMIRSIDDVERALLRIIADSNGEVSGVIQDRLREATGTGVKKYNQMIGKLEHIGLIETIPVKGRGQTREIRLKNTVEDVRELV